MQVAGMEGNGRGKATSAGNGYKYFRSRLVDCSHPLTPEKEEISSVKSTSLSKVLQS